MPVDIFQFTFPLLSDVSYSDDCWKKKAFSMVPPFLNNSDIWFLVISYVFPQTFPPISTGDLMDGNGREKT